ncbi:MAG: TOBE domain-containing protein [Dehalococcoidia bacterium]
MSARNQLRGTVKSILRDTVVSEVVVDVAGQEVAAVITTTSVDRLRLREGQPIVVVIKATEVMLENV